MNSNQDKNLNSNESNAMKKLNVVEQKVGHASVVEWPLVQALENYKMNNEIILMEAATCAIESFNSSMTAICHFGELKLKTHAPVVDKNDFFDATKDAKCFLSRFVCKKVDELKMPGTALMKDRFLKELQKSEDFVLIDFKNDDSTSINEVAFECHFVKEKVVLEVCISAGTSLDSDKERLLKKIWNVFNELTGQVAGSYYDAVFETRKKLQEKYPSTLPDTDKDEDQQRLSDWI